jgi:hypothetical protein
MLAQRAVLTNVDIDGVNWDNHNHLFAISGGTNQVFVYTITPTSLTPAPGSPYVIPSATGLHGMVVVPM